MRVIEILEHMNSTEPSWLENGQIEGKHFTLEKLEETA